jgi:hypothetical protein
MSGHGSVWAYAELNDEVADVLFAPQAAEPIAVTMAD